MSRQMIPSFFAKFSLSLSSIYHCTILINGRFFNWWKENRDVDGNGLVTILHPWESGIDLSPAYDPALGVPESISPLDHSDDRRTS